MVLVTGIPNPEAATPPRPHGAAAAAAAWAVPQLTDLVARGVSWVPDPRPVLAAPSRTAAVLVLFGARDDASSGDPGGNGAAGDVGAGDLDLLVIRRATTLRHHPGQVALPGGGCEPGDVDNAATALRETQEETGALPGGIRVIGELPPFHLHVSGNLTTPVIGWWEEPSPIWVADERELDLVRRVPLTMLLDPTRRVRAELRDPGASAPAYWTPAIELDVALMWGFTAKVVTTILAALGWEPEIDWHAVRAVDPRAWTEPPGA